MTHWLLSHQLYKVTRGQERGGASVSARGDSGEGHELQPSLWAPWQGWDFSGYSDGIACKQELFREGWCGGGVLLSLSQRVGAEQGQHASPS